MILKCLTLLALCFVAGMPNAAQATSPTFNVTPIHPVSQTDTSLGYYDIRLASGQSEVLELELMNGLDQERTFVIYANAAFTNMNGVIDYTPDHQEYDETLVLSFNDVVEKDSQEITIAANATEIVSVAIEMPSQSFDGIILGGITVEEAAMEETEDAANVFSYTIAVVISQNDQVTVADMALKGVYLDQRNRRTVIVADLQNPVPMILNDIHVQASVFKDGAAQPLFYTEKSEMRMAPHSILPFGIGTDDQHLQAGTYRVELAVTANEEDEWHFEGSFEVSQEQARQFNDSAVDLADPPANYMWIAIVAVICCFVLSLALILTRRKK
ncbi:DUF916 and DUF3324 domain-containing protein [Enterococcus sp. DIV0876]|uniref:DUF916 and DUF3324 domain-containing protein n=1 Tax=Enterococcus sp. DIV0876 TaxID=2774633 RepID=UPI003D2FF153